MYNHQLLLQIADKCLLEGLFCQHQGLWDGKTGMSIFFFLLSRITNNNRYEEFASRLLDDVCSNLSSRTPVTFADGLCGVGWAIEFLSSEGFIEGNVDEILSEVDKQIMERDVRRITDFSLETGLKGIVAYIQSRIEKNSLIQTFDRNYLEEVRNACKRANIQWDAENWGLYPVWNRIIQHFSNTPNKDISDWRTGLTLLKKLDTHTPHRFLDLFFNHSYENELYHSSRKCLFIFSIDNVASNYGIGTYIQQIIKCFDLKEWEVNIVTLDKTSSNEITFKLIEGIGWYDIPSKKELLPFNSFKSINMDTYYNGVFYFLASRLNLEKEVYCHFNFTLHHTLAALFKKELKAHIIFTLHYMAWNIILQGDKEQLKYQLMEPDSRIKVLFEKEKLFMTECCDKIIAIAEHAYHTLHQLYGIPYDKLVCIPNGVQDDYKERSEAEKRNLRMKYDFTTNEKIILYAGRLELGKGIVELIKAFNDVNKTIPNTRLVIAGNGNFNDSLNESNPTWNHITYTGFIPKKQLYELYAIADIGVVPSFHEEFGYVAAEMMLHKLPVVVNNTMGLQEITENGKYAIAFHYGPNRDIAPLKETLKNALSSKKDIQKIESGRNRIITHYSLNKFQEQIKVLYTNIQEQK